MFANQKPAARNIELNASTVNYSVVNAEQDWCCSMLMAT